MYVCMYIKKNRKEKENLIFFFTSHITCKHNPLHMGCVGNFSTYKVILDLKNSNLDEFWIFPFPNEIENVHLRVMISESRV